MNIINIYENYNNYFNSDLKIIFELASKIASKTSYRIYLVGGIVRDLLLNRKNSDIDITVEGNAIEFAKILENAGCAKILSLHKDFGTAKLEINGEKIDFASTRSEIYPKKGHLPQIEKIGCSLEKDVIRRDFTINSLAISLNKSDFANLIDYVGGYEDLKAKKVRILHENSFIDDPTRIIRALRYSTQLGFKIEKNTLKLQEEYLNNINYDMSNKRLKTEIKRTFELNSQETFDKFIDQKIYKLVAPNFTPHPTPTSRERYSIIPSAESQGAREIASLVNKYNAKNPWLVYFGVVIMSDEENLLEKLEFTKIEKEIILSAKNLINFKLKSDFEIYKAFCDKSLETLLILAILGKEKEVYHYLDNLSKVKLSVTGKDLLNLGIASSKSFGDCFDYILKEKLKNPLLKKAQELELAAKYFGHPQI